MLNQIIFAGFGGQGMLLAGLLLAEAGMMEDKYVSWIPSYGPEIRGGTANCSVCVSDREIASPVITTPDCVITMNYPSLAKFEETIRPGGLIIINSSIVDAKTNRSDIEAMYIKVNEIAEELSNPKGANIVALGAYIQKTGVVKPESVAAVIEKKMGGKKARFIEGNLKTLYAGVDVAK